MPLTRADAAPAMAIVKLGMKHGGLALDLERLLVGMKVDCVSAATRSLPAYRTIAPHEWYWRMAVGGKANLAAATRPVELQGHGQILSHGELVGSGRVPPTSRPLSRSLALPDSGRAAIKVKIRNKSLFWLPHQIGHCSFPLSRNFDQADGHAKPTDACVSSGKLACAIRALV
jgi:hypothetical protein